MPDMLAAQPPSAVRMAIVAPMPRERPVLPACGILEFVFMMVPAVSEVCGP